MQEQIKYVHEKSTRTSRKTNTSTSRPALFPMCPCLIPLCASLLTQNAENINLITLLGSFLHFTTHKSTKSPRTATSIFNFPLMPKQAILHKNASLQTHKLSSPHLHFPSLTPPSLSLSPTPQRKGKKGKGQEQEQEAKSTIHSTNNRSLWHLPFNSTGKQQLHF